MSPDSWWSALDRHRERRADGIPTVSVLVGPPGLALGRFREWCAVAGPRPEMVTAGSDEEIARAWIRSWWSAGNPAERLLRYLARFEGVAVPSTPGRSLADLRVWSASILSRARPSQGTRLAARLLEGLDEDGNRLFLPGPDPFLGGALQDSVAGLREIDPASSPAVILSGLAAWTPETIEAAARGLAGIAEAVPEAALAWALPREALGIILDEIPESRWKALCREGIVEISALDAGEIQDRLAASGWTGGGLAASAHCLARDGADLELADAFEAAVRAIPAAGGPEGVARARSAAEAFLWKRLETLPETAGLFALNRKVDLGIGRPLEIDLFASGPRVAIEIDGPFHFADREAYRADRRRDYLLQRAGCLVLRFLPEDVVECLEAILATIREAISVRNRP